MSFSKLRQWKNDLKNKEKSYSSYLDRYCNYRDKTEIEIVEEAKNSTRVARKYLKKYLDELKIDSQNKYGVTDSNPFEHNKAMSKKRLVEKGKILNEDTILKIKSAVISWLKFNQISTESLSKIPIGKSITLSLESPKNDELISLFDKANLRTKVILSLMAFCGVKPDAISSLKISDFSEICIDDNDGIQINKIPTFLKLREEVTGKNEYYVFLIKEGCFYLKNYLEKRLGKEKLFGNSPIIGSKKILNEKGVKAILKRLDPNLDPVTLERHYIGVIRNSGMPHDIQYFFLGYKSQDKDKQNVEVLRDMFTKLEHNLSVMNIKNTK